MITNDQLKLSTIVAAAISFIAYMKQFIFYQYFGIDISNYTQFSDFLTPFIDDLTINIGILIVSLFLSYSFREAPKAQVEPELKSDSPFKKGIIIIVIDFIYDNWLIIMMLISLFSYCSIIHRLSGNSKIFFHTTGACLLVLTHIWIVRKTNLLNDIGLTDIWQRASYYVLANIALVNLLLISFDVIKIQYSLDKNAQITFKMKGDEFINTDSTSVYMGRTKSNFFIFRKELNSVHIFKTDDIIIEKIKQ